MHPAIEVDRHDTSGLFGTRVALVQCLSCIQLRSFGYKFQIELLVVDSSC